MSDKYLFSIPEAAAEVECSERFIREAIHEGLVDAEEVGRRWVLTAEQVRDLEELVEEEEAAAEEDEVEDDDEE